MVYNHETFAGKKATLEMKKHNNYSFVFLHGIGGTTNEIFWPQLKKLLEAKGHAVQAPQLPDTDAPNVYRQVSFVLEHCQLNEGTILVGHSMGAVVGLKVLEQLQKPMTAFFHIASPINSDFKDGVERPIIFDWQFNFEKAKRNAGAVTVISDVNDYAVPVEHAKIVAEKLSGKLIVTEAVEPHFCASEEPVIFDAIFRLCN